MYGFFGKYGSFNLSYDLSSIKGKTIERETSFFDFSVQQKTLDKFLNDKVFVNTENYFFLTEGVLLNSNELLKQYGFSELVDLIPFLYEKIGETFFNSFRGTFSGVFYDKQKDVCLIFNDQIGSKLIFYTKYKDGCCFGSDLRILFEALSDKVTFQYDMQFVYSMLTFAYSPVCHTIIDGIMRVPAGHYLRIEKNNVRLLKYHMFGNIPQKITESEAVSKLDELFRQAVSRVLKKNEQYNLENYMPLSAGMDSRTTLWVAKQLTKNKIVNVTYSQSDFYDENVPKSIAKYLGNEMKFKKLDGGEYLKNIEKSISQSCGLLHYSGVAQTDFGFEDVDVDSVGVVATGMDGEQVMGTFYTQKSEMQQPEYGEKAYSKMFLKDLRNYLSSDFMSVYPNIEIYTLYVRGFGCANLGSPLLFQNYTESFSPFCDVDFMDFAFSIPHTMKWDYNLYDLWIKTKYPEATSWLHNGSRVIGEKKMYLSVLGRRIAVKDLPKRMLMYLLKKLKVYNFEKCTKGNSMNPMDTWFKENESLKKYIDAYFKQNIDLLLFDEKAKNCAAILYEKGTVMEKLQVITLLGCLNYCKIPLS
ncbi:MAG: hypothetical protein MJ198_03650 [Bacteroidales bacterium]|nr:hypothetical protein [Bacteroidales bacterium]